jgi:hypothetical protein
MKVILIMSKHESSGSSIACLIFLLIILFIAVYYPLRGGNLQFEFGVLFRNIYYTIGMYVLFFGVIFMLVGILAFFSHRPLSGFFFLLLGVIFMAISGYFFNPTGSGASGNGTEVPRGYH